MRRLVASFFGTGLLLRRLAGVDRGSGTVASAFALTISLLLETNGQLAALAISVGLSLWSTSGLGDDESPGDHDPPWVVIDEAAGTFLATVGLGGPPALVAWVVFRLADIAKKVFPGVAAAERLPGSLGVTADDLVAGLYGLAAGWAIQFVTQ